MLMEENKTHRLYYIVNAGSHNNVQQRYYTASVIHNIINFIQISSYPSFPTFLLLAYIHFIFNKVPFSFKTLIFLSLLLYVIESHGVLPAHSNLPISGETTLFSWCYVWFIHLPCRCILAHCLGLYYLLSPPKRREDWPVMLLTRVIDNIIMSFAFQKINYNSTSCYDWEKKMPDEQLPTTETW